MKEYMNFAFLLIIHIFFI